MAAAKGTAAGARQAAPAAVEAAKVPVMASGQPWPVMEGWAQVPLAPKRSVQGMAPGVCLQAAWAAAAAAAASCLLLVWVAAGCCWWSCRRVHPVAMAAVARAGLVPLGWTAAMGQLASWVPEEGAAQCLGWWRGQVERVMQAARWGLAVQCLCLMGCC